ncbi:MAG: class I SAM-dependent methyltransferase [Alphaproteobacteria bacterium]|nr:class I SAM-dependent methyltransferase [Alphaproteobacteria bacterium]
MVAEAIAARAGLMEALAAEDTDCLRLFHGATEGRPGLAVDRYGPLLLVQTWRRPLTEPTLAAIAAAVADAGLPGLHLCWNHRGRRGDGHGRDGRPTRFDDWFQPDADALALHHCREQGRRMRIRARHRGRDPWLYLDFRVARRWLAAHARDRSVLNLFAYTATAGLAAACGGATDVLNLDFADSALEVGAANAADNAAAFGLDAERFELVQADVLPASRQLAGLPVKGRGARRRRFRPFAPRSFDIVVLDPPTWATSAFGAVDIVGDYPTLFKPAVLATRPGGVVLATNHAAEVDGHAWESGLARCAAKAGRPLARIERLVPDADFPSPDGRPPLKIACCTLARDGEPVL